MTSPIRQLQELDQQVWLDAIRRSWLADGGYLHRLVESGELDGLTSNPTIFEEALGGDEAYASQIAELAGTEPREAFWAIAGDDVASACDLFLPVWKRSGGDAGYVSIEVDPRKAFDTEETVAEALLLYRQLDRPNLMIKVPGTEPGLAAIPRLIAEGVNINVTLLFSVARYEQVAHAYMDGLRRLADAGGDVTDVASVASFFVSRVDAKVDRLLGEDHPLRGTAAVANARSAYGVFRQLFDGEAFADLREAGARVQRPLWASSSPKDPAYRDTMYVEELAGPRTVNTMPDSTLETAREDAVIADRLTGRADEARDQLQALADEGVDLDQVTKELEAEGVDKFVASFEAAIDALAARL
jgi:transaldolase